MNLYIVYLYREEYITSGGKRHPVGGDYMDALVAAEDEAAVKRLMRECSYHQWDFDKDTYLISKVGVAEPGITQKILLYDLGKRGR